VSSSTTRRLVPSLLVIAFGTLFAALHLFRIEADTPENLGPVVFDSGAHCDEGYKTLAARNVVQFGSTRWSESDEYAGWGAFASRPDYLAFKVFGVRLVHARIVSLVFGLGCCFLFHAVLKRRFGEVRALAGSLLFMLHPAFMIYTRLALLEIKMLFFVLLAVYSLPTARTNSGTLVLRGSVAVGALLALYYTKPTALMLVATFGAAGGILLLERIVKSQTLLRWSLASIAFAAIAVAGYLEVFWDFDGREVIVRERVVSSPIDALRSFLVLDLFMLNPALPILALIGTYRLMRRTPPGRTHPWDEVLMPCWLWGLALGFASLEYHPLRYFLLALPALVWLAMEGWVRIEEILIDPLGRGWDPSRIVVLALCILFGMNLFVPSVLVAAPVGGDPGVHPTTMIDPRVLPISVTVSLLLALAANGLAASRPDLTRKGFKAVSVAALAVSLVVSLVPLIGWLRSPSYDLVGATRLVRSLGPDAILVGDWAPQLGIDAGIRVIYSNWNPGQRHAVNLENMREVGATHIAVVDGINDAYREKMDSLYPGARSSAPTLEFPLAGRTVRIYEFRP
jgi:hypothetical protein